MSRSKEQAEKKEDKPSEARRPKDKEFGRKLRDLIIVLAAVGAVHFLLAEIVYTLLLHTAAQRAIDELFTAGVERVGKIEITPDGDLALRDISLVTREGDICRPFMQAGRLLIVFQGNIWTLLFGRDALLLRRVDIEQPQLHFVREPDGTWNVSRAFAPRPRRAPDPPPDQPKPAEPPRDLFPQNGIHLKDGTIHVRLFNTNGKEVQWSIGSMNCVLTKDRWGLLKFVDPKTNTDNIIWGTAYGGKVRLETKITRMNPLEGDLGIQVFDADVSKLTQDVELGRRIKGKLTLVLTLRRSMHETNGQVVGSGRARVVDGDLYDYPPIVSAIGLLGLQSGDRKIDTLWLDINIRTDHIEIKEINLLGTPVSMFGDGQCNLWGEDLYVVLVPKMGRGDHINLANVLVGEFVVVVEGAVLNPQAHVRPFNTILAPFRAVARFFGGK